MELKDNEEIWKDLVEYEGLYKVSNKGNVKSLSYRRSSNEKLMTNQNRNGRIFVTLCKNGKCKFARVHRLVALCFIPNPENKKEIDHIDGNPSNNHVENLRWATRTENQNNPITRLISSMCRRGEKHHNYGKHLSEQTRERIKIANSGEKCWNYGNTGIKSPYSIKVIQLDMNMNFIKEWDSISDIKRELKLDNISAACKGKYNHVNGYKWMYKSDYEKLLNNK